MDYIQRNIDKALMSWKTDTDRKPLLIRGARQVGKSSSIEQPCITPRYSVSIPPQTHAMPAYPFV